VTNAFVAVVRNAVVTNVFVVLVRIAVVTNAFGVVVGIVLVTNVFVVLVRNVFVTNVFVTDMFGSRPLPVLVAAGSGSSGQRAAGPPRCGRVRDERVR